MRAHAVWLPRQCPSYETPTVSKDFLWAESTPLYRPNRALLFHGTKTDSLPSILKKGILLGSENPMHGRSGAMFGSGVYLATTPLKSDEYARGSLGDWVGAGRGGASTLGFDDSEQGRAWREFVQRTQVGR